MDFILQNKRFTFIFVAIILVTLYPYLNAFVFSADDYILFYFKTMENKLVEDSIGNGRWFGSFLVNLIGAFSGSSGFSAILLSYLSLVFQWLIVALILARQFGLDINKWQVPILISFAFIHIFCAEILTFKLAVVSEGLSFVYLTAIGGWYLIKRFDKRFAAGVLLIMLALATYQVFMNILIVLTLMGFVFGLVHDIHSGKSTGFRNLIKNEYIIKLCGICVATLFYLIANRYVLSTLEIGISNRSEFLSFNELGKRFSDIMALFGNILTRDNFFLVPFAVKMVILVVIFSAMIISVQTIWKGKSENTLYKLFISASVLVLIVTALLSSALASLFLKEMWLVPRMFTGFGFFIMMCLIIILKFNQSSWFRHVLSILIGLLAYSFISVHHNVANEQLYLNYLDRNKAGRILSDLQEIENYGSKRIYIHQREDCWINGANMTHHYGDLNLSAFCTAWSKYELLQFVAGETFKRTTTEENIDLDNKYKLMPDSLKPRWPGKDGIRVTGDIIEIYP